MSDEYQEYLQKIANQNTTSSEKVDSFVREAIGNVPKIKSRIMLGEANEVYDVESVGGERVIVRIHKSDRPVFDQEKWAIEKCAQKGIPVPSVFLIKHEQEGDKILSICVQQKLPGDTLERGKIDYWDMPDDQSKKLLTDSGEILARIHSVPVTGFGDLDASGRGKYSTFSEMILEKPGQLESYLTMAKELGITTADIESALQVVTREGKRINVTSPVLNHGDFGAKHILYEGTRVTGIVDFGEVLGNSPVFDFARWEYWFGDNKYLQWLKEGYTDKSIFSEGFNELSRLLQLDMSLGTTWWYFKEGYAKGIKRGLEKTKELLKKYER